MLKVVRVALWLSAAAWVGLVVARGKFWDASADGLRDPLPGEDTPNVHAVVPARDEADVLERTLGSLADQRYAGSFAVTLVNDRSSDGTPEVAQATALAHAAADRITVVDARPRPDGWTGKVWAMAEGIAAARAAGAAPAYWWLSDADVEHDSQQLARLVATAERDHRGLVSQMVLLHAQSSWERLLIPAFEFFFRMLYPFAWVNDDRRETAGAAGGCILISDEALRKIGGIERIAGEMIDDCSLASAVKREGYGLRLILATRSRSIRPYGGLEPIWSMVARTAYTQLRYSPLLVAGTVAGMVFLYVLPIRGVVGGLVTRRADIAVPGLIAWLMMTLAYVPTVRRYGFPARDAVALPFAGLLYTAMTVDSARRHHRGAGGVWKGRAFAPK